MNYEQLAAEFLNHMQKAEPQKAFDVGMCGETFILHYIGERGSDSVTPSEIGNAMNVSSARVAAALNTLEKKGLVSREIDKTDRRKILVKLTGEGKAMAEEQKRRSLQKLTDMLRILGERDAREFVRIMAKLSEISRELAP